MNASKACCECACFKSGLDGGTCHVRGLVISDEVAEKDCLDTYYGCFVRVREVSY